MKRKMLGIAFAGLLLASCGGPDKAAYDQAATKICDCMSKKQADEDNSESGIEIDMTDLNYSLCALEVVGDVDPFDKQMGESIADKCPDLKEVHEKYVKQQ